MTTIPYSQITPSISNSLSVGWKKMMEQFLPLLLIVVICAILQGAFKFTGQSGDFHFWMILLVPIALAYGFLFWPVIDFGSDYLFLKATRSQKVEVGELFDGFRTKFLQIVLANLLVFALVMVGLVLLIIPGIIIACRLVVGVLVSAMWISASFAALYQSVLEYRQNNETLPILGVNYEPDGK